jgi:ribosomal protein S18 acetylase RimI-like enzyme
MSFTVRTAIPTDAPAIAQVQIESWRSTYAGIVPDEFLASMSLEKGIDRWQQVIVAPGNLTFVAEGLDGLFGFICGGKLRANHDGYWPDGFDAELYAIYLLQQHQRIGAGRALVQTLVHALREQGYRSMAVWVLKENPAVGFYRKLGAVQLAEMKIAIAGVSLPELALGWPQLASWAD